MDKKESIMRFADKRPEARAVFGYGSGVFEQDISTSKPLTDVIFVVDDLRKWHHDNMEVNSNDYSLIGRIHLSRDNMRKLKGKNFVTYFSEIKDKDIEYTFKYGVVEENDFVRNLGTWENLFLVGRFHKPVLDVFSNEKIEEVINQNRECAFRIACILSNPLIEKEELFELICGLSYMGDARMRFAENPHKVECIVKNSFEKLESIYKFEEPYVRLFSRNLVLINHEILMSEIEMLPECLVDYLASVDTNLCDLEMVRRNILDYIINHNKIESKAQIFEGIKTNGIIRSIPYAFAKVKKKFMSK